MKTNTLVILASLAVLATSASAASSQPETNVVVLPAYTVSTPRYQPAEMKVNASLDELRRQASAPVSTTIDLPMLETKAVRQHVMERAGHDLKAFRFAGL
jgi:hypothetical protein